MHVHIFTCLHVWRTYMFNHVQCMCIRYLFFCYPGISRAGFFDPPPGISRLGCWRKSRCTSDPNWHRIGASLCCPPSRCSLFWPHSSIASCTFVRSLTCARCFACCTSEEYILFRLLRGQKIKAMHAVEEFNKCNQRIPQVFGVLPNP